MANRLNTKRITTFNGAIVVLVKAGFTVSYTEGCEYSGGSIELDGQPFITESSKCLDYTVSTLIDAAEDFTSEMKARSESKNTGVNVVSFKEALKIF